MLEPIPQYLLDRAARSATRRIAACCISCMADTDASLAQIAKRIGKSEDGLREWLRRLIDGEPKNADMNSFSDFLIAMGAEPVFSIRPCDFLNEPAPEPEQATAA